MSMSCILSTLCLTLFAAVGTAADVSSQTSFSLKEVEGEYQLLWGEQIVLRRLELKLHGQKVEFDPSLVDFQPEGKNCAFGREGGGVGGVMQLTGMFALSFQPEVWRSQPLEGGMLQYVSGKTAGRNCDTVFAPETGLGVRLSGSDLDIPGYQAGAPLIIRLYLDQNPTLTLVDAAERPTDQNDLVGLETELKRRFANKDGKLPRTLQQLVAQPQRKPRHFKLLNLAQVQPSAETQIVNFRIGEGAAFPAQDVLLFLNGSDQKRKLTANFQDLGWDKIKMRRIAVQYPDGDCLGEFRNALSVDVPANGWSVVLLRKLMPRGIVATSDGPFYSLDHNWIWTGSGTAKSGSRSFFAAYEGPSAREEGGWMILSTANGAQTPYTLERFSDPDGNPFQFTYNQGDCWAKVEYPVNENPSQTVHIHFGGAGPGGGPGGGPSGKNQPGFGRN